MRQGRVKEPVRLRSKMLKDGCESLYLDIYWNGTRSYEFLKLYLLPEAEKGAKARNKETMAIAMTLKSERIVALQRGEYNFAPAGGKKVDLIDFIDQERQGYEERGSDCYAANLKSLSSHLKVFTKGRKALASVDKKFIVSFLDYLDRCGMMGSSRTMFLLLLSTILNRAVKAGLIDRNPVKLLSKEDRPENDSREREYLTLDEVRKIEAVVGDDPFLQRAAFPFLFSCFTGLRYSDVSNLQWGNIVNSADGGYEIHIKQQKTRSTVVVPLTDNAMRFMPSGRGAASDYVFPDLLQNQHSNVRLRQIAEQAGIDKYISFHVARHTYATMLLTYGADLYTVSKLLGHTDISTTQIYAKLVDSKRRDAVDLIPAL